MNAAQADAHAVREQLNALASPAATPGREQVEAAFEALQESIGDVLSQDRSPHLLGELYASLGLALTWHHNDRRLAARLDLGPTVSSVAEPSEEVGLDPVSEGGLEPPCPVRGTSTSS
jgi:hypothetical protein